MTNPKMMVAVAALASMRLGMAAEPPGRTGRTRSDGKLKEPTPEPQQPEAAPEPVPPPNDGAGIPNRLSIDHSSPHYTPSGAYVGVLLDGIDVSGRVAEFNRSMGWVRLLPAGQKGTRHSVAAAPKSFGKVETYWRAQASRQVRRQFARMT